MTVRATPFHVRVAERNPGDAWCWRNGLNVAAHFGHPEVEAIAARFSAVVSDISWRSRVNVSGARAPEFLSRLATRDASALAVGSALKALWLNDAGAVRGAGVFARLDEESFQIVSAADDFDWLSRAAAMFGVNAIETSASGAGLAVIGPYARRVLRAAGIEIAVEPLSLLRTRCDGLGILLSRFGEHAGFEIWCDNADATALWDRIADAGKSYALLPVGAVAMDILDIEAGVARPGRDYIPARDAFAADPTPGSLALESLIDPAHTTFNGHRSWNARTKVKETKTIVGVEFEGELSASFAPLFKDGVNVGTTLTSYRSPALRCAIALAEIESVHAVEGNALAVRESASLDKREPSLVTARVTGLPFLPAPDPIA